MPPTTAEYQLDASLDQAAIEQQAEQLLAAQRITKPPVKVDMVASRLDCSLREARFAQGDVSGCVTRKDGQTTIYVRHSDHLNRKRFTIAHEIGHVVLGHLNLREGAEYFDVTVNLFRGGAASPTWDDKRRIEWQANLFAAALLMPAPWVEREYQRAGSVAELATKFGVSEEAMGYRLRDVGLI